LLTIDSREKKEIRAYLWKRGIKYNVDALKTGDYLFTDPKNPNIRVLVERKSIADLVSSYLDGRIQSQFARLSKEPFPILLVTGKIADLRGKLPFRPDEKLVEKVLAIAVVKYGFRSVIWIVGGFKDPKHEGLVFLANTFKELSLGNLDQIPPQKRVGSRTHPMVESVCAMFGVPINVGENLLNKFGNLRGIINAKDTELLSVEGVGVTRIKRIRDILDGSFGTKKPMESKSKKSPQTSNDQCPRCDHLMVMLTFGDKKVFVCNNMKCKGR